MISCDSTQFLHENAAKVCQIGHDCFFQHNSTFIIHKLIFSVVLYGCETWSVTLREEYRIRVSKNRVLRGIFGAKREEVTGEC